MAASLVSVPISGISPDFSLCLFSVWFLMKWEENQRNYISCVFGCRENAGK